MIRHNDKIVAGISGGADSTCLFFILLELRDQYNLEIFVVHINHGIRGGAAQNDSDYVEGLCKEHGVSFELVAADIKTLALQNGTSEEEEGRNVRYQAFYKALNKNKADKIAVAHNKNDQAETVLFNLFRGSGMNGLVGIRPVRGQIIRPLLCIERGEIETYLAERNILYCTDATNSETCYTRNKIRLKVLSYVTEEINVKAVNHIGETTVMLKEIEAYVKKNAEISYKQIVTKKSGQYSFQTEKFLKEDIVVQKAIIQKILEELAGQLKDVTKEHITMVLSLLQKQVGKVVHLPYGIVAVRGYEDIWLYKASSIVLTETKVTPVIEANIPGTYYIEQIKQFIEIKLLAMTEEKIKIIPQNGYTKWFDYDKIKNTVLLRTRQEGDYFQIDKRGSKKKLKAFFIDNKIPKENRNSIPLLADGSHIIWIIGHRISEAYKIDKNTKKILCVKLYGGE